MRYLMVFAILVSGCSEPSEILPPDRPYTYEQELASQQQEHHRRQRMSLAFLAIAVMGMMGRRR